jgi:DNA-binding XRE family transcriptional regulator
MISLQKSKVGSTHPKKLNCVQELREEKMMSKAELARIAGVTVQTIDRIEKGCDCRMDTKRKILLALGYQLVDRQKLFFEVNWEETTPGGTIQSFTPSMQPKRVASHPISSWIFRCDTTRREPRFGIELILTGALILMPSIYFNASSIFSTIFPAFDLNFFGFMI